MGISGLQALPFDFDCLVGGPGRIVLMTAVGFVASDTNIILFLLSQFGNGLPDGFAVFYRNGLAGTKAAFGGVLNLITGSLAVFLPGQGQLS